MTEEGVEVTDGKDRTACALDEGTGGADVGMSEREDVSEETVGEPC